MVKHGANILQSALDSSAFFDSPEGGTYMTMNARIKKLFSTLLCVSMLVQNAPAMAFAAAEDNLCDHHPEHTAECGYAAEEGEACAYNCEICLDHGSEEEEQETTAPSEPETTEAAEITEETKAPEITESEEPIELLRSMMMRISSACPLLT